VATTTPTVRGVTEGAGASSTTHTITFTQTTGDLVVIFLANDATARTWSLGDSFTNLTNTSATFHIFTKVLDGSEGGNMVATAGVATKSAWLAYNITTGTHASGTAPVFSTVATGTSTAPDSGSLSPTGGSAKYLWLSAFGMAGEEADDDTWCNSAPSTPGTFTGLAQKTTAIAGAVTVNCEVAAAQYASETATVDPGAFDTDQSLAWRAYTVAIYPGTTTDAPAGHAAGTGAAYAPTISTSKSVSAGHAAGTGGASWGASYSTTILADSPVGYWRLGEPSGTNANDETANNYDGTYTGTCTLNVTGLLTGDSDKSVSVAGSGHVVLPSGVNPWSSDFSVEMWLKPASASAYTNVFAKGTYLTNGFAISQFGTKWHAETTNNGGTVEVTAVATVDTGRADHVVVTRTGTSWVLWVNGVSATTTGTYVAPSGGGDFVNGWSGTLDEGAVYSSVLSSTQVAAHYAAGTGGGGGGTTAKVSPSAGLAAGTGDAYNPPFASATNANAGLAEGTGAAYSPPIKFALVGLASGVGAANAPPASVAPSAGVATGTGAAYTPTLTCASNANAGHAAGTGVAYQPVPKPAPNAGHASGTGAAYLASTKVAPAAGVGTGTGTAYGPPIKYVLAGHAAGTGAAYGPTLTCASNAVAGHASGTGAAYGASETVAPNAGLAAGTGDAYQPTVETGGAPATSVYPDCASGSGAALAATPKIEAPAGHAAGTGAAFGASETVAPNAGLAAATGAAYGPPIKYAPVGLASATGAAAAPAAAVSPSAGAGAATGAAGAPIPSLGPSAGHAAATGGAADTGKTVTPNAGGSAGTGSAYEPTVSTSTGGTFVYPDCASGTVDAFGPSVTASPSVYAWCDTATGTGAAYGATLPTISGVTRDENGAAIPLCTVDAFVSSTNAYYATTTSDATGRYSIIVAPGVYYFLVAYDLVGDVYGVTARDLSA